LKLKNFQKFDSAATALEEVTAIIEGKVTPRLASLLDEIKDEKKVSLAVADPKLGEFDFDKRCAKVRFPNISQAMLSESFPALTFSPLRTLLLPIFTALSVNTFLL
jgi:RNA processing factor Prp31